MIIDILESALIFYLGWWYIVYHFKTTLYEKILKNNKSRFSDWEKIQDILDQKSPWTIFKYLNKNGTRKED